MVRQTSYRHNFSWK